MAAVMKDKAMLRKLVRERLAMLSAETKTARSIAIMESLKAHLAVSGARVIALFSPLCDEPQLWELIEWLSKTKVVLLPRVEGDTMRFYGYSKDEMSKGAFGIMEPSSTECVAPDEIDAVVVPGVAFTVSGARMGRGKGFYDKYMLQPSFRALKLGVCYDEQIVEELPVEPHDVLMDVVVSG